MQATARTAGQRSSWWPVKIFSLSAFRLAIRGLYLYFFLQSLCLFINFFDKWTAIAFDLAAWRLSLQQGSSSLLCLWLPLAAAILVLSNTTSPESRCMALQQLVWRCSLWDTAVLNFSSILVVFSLTQALTPALILWHSTVGLLYPSATPMYVGC